MIHIRQMTQADLPLGLRLTAQAGWNQTVADWRGFLWLAPDGCFVAERDGGAVGTTVCILLGKVAWLAMVLVDTAMRGRGIGTALVQHALAFADARGAASVRLDATPLGRPIYEKLGFSEDFLLRRYEGSPPPSCFPVLTRMLGPDDWSEVLSLDRLVTGMDREPVLRRLYHGRPTAFRVYRSDKGLLGFVVWRWGANADFVGPCVAASPADGELLLRDSFRDRAGRRLIIDVPENNHRAVSCMSVFGLAFQRPLLRMTRGEPVREDLSLLWASSGPEKG
jgi:predicted N-acetyltransferase YhbS